MKVLVVGGSGMLGSGVVGVFQLLGDEVSAPTREELDITNPESVTTSLLCPDKPDWCINCAAYTAVDAAETHVDEATAVNTLGPGYLARACALAGIRLIHISTDFVFDGQKSTPYVEEDLPNPLAVYGRTKLEGEEAVMAADPRAIILRTAWLFGPRGKSFPRTMIEAARTGKPLRVVNDQIGTPTYTADLASVIVQCVEADLPGGMYHAAGPDMMSWFEFARLTVGPGIEIDPIPTTEWPTPARRPVNSALSSQKLIEHGIGPMRPIEEAIGAFKLHLSS